jgi:hypothetical protein
MDQKTIFENSVKNNAPNPAHLPSSTIACVRPVRSQSPRGFNFGLSKIPGFPSANTRHGIDSFRDRNGTARHV